MRFLFLLIPLGLLTSCSFFTDRQTILSVGDLRFSKKYFADRLIEKLKNVDGLHIKSKDLVSSLSQQLEKEIITEGFLTLWANSVELRLTSSDLASYMEKNLTSEDHSSANFLLEARPSKKLLEDHLKMQIIKGKLIENLQQAILVTPEEISAYYKSKSPFMSAPEIHVKQILLSGEEDAKSILQKLNTGSSFESLATKFSLSSEGSRGGDLGWLKKKDFPYFEQFVQSPPGLIRKVYSQQSGFYIYKLVEVKKSAVQPLDKVRDQVLNEIKKQKLTEAYSLWLQNQVKTVKVFSNDSLLQSVTSQYQENL